MACYTGYINLDNLTSSRTGLYLDSLPGIDVITIDAIRKSGNDTDATWEIIYKRAWDNLVSDISEALQNKFFVDSKLISRETSQLKITYGSSGDAGVKLTFSLSRYSRIHVISVDVYSQTDYTGVPIRFYDTDSSGELLLTKLATLETGNNTINIDTDFDVDILYVVINTSTYTIRQTENKDYHGYSWILPDLCEWDYVGGRNLIEQVNGGGINLKYTVECSIEKFVCENINLFKQAFLWRLGIEVTHERRFGERLNEFTTMTVDRAKELEEYFTDQYEQKLTNAVKSQNIREDYVCFNCKNVVTTKTVLP